MCGRYSLHSHPDVVALQFGLSSVAAFQPRYNIAPSATVLVVRDQGAAMLRWGLIPRWAKDAAIGAKMNNARAESVAEKPAFSDAYRKRRCLIPANGFYEWKRESGRKQPYYVHPAQGALFAFAGLWEAWRDLQTCTIVTTEANGVMRRIHDRMPVIVARENYSKWLGGEEGLLSPAPSEAIRAYPVGSAVNRAAIESATLIEPLPSGLERQGTTGQLFGD
jgi:putative SOS response-associated peptidase YedK